MKVIGKIGKQLACISIKVNKVHKGNKILFTKKINFGTTTINYSHYHVSQTNSFNEELILVDENDRKVGSITKLDGKIECHSK